MKYASIDIETTGIDPEKHQVIEIGAVVRELGSETPPEKEPSINILIPRDNYVLSAGAIRMHQQLFSELEQAMFMRSGSGFIGGSMVVSHGRAIYHLESFLRYHFEETGILRVPVLGKNFMSFDARFLEKLPNYGHSMKFSSRCLDPAPFFMRTDDEKPPSFAECKERSSIEFDESYSHRAYQDAIDTIKLFEEGFFKNQDQ